MNSVVGDMTDACKVAVSLTTQLDVSDERHTVITVELEASTPDLIRDVFSSSSTYECAGNTYTILTLKAWQDEIRARAARGRHYGVVLSGIPFRVQESMIHVWAKILKAFGTLSSYSINERGATGSGFDGSVTLGLDLGELSEPTHLPKIPLIYGGKYYLSLDPRLGQVRVIGEKSCRVCPAIAGHCANPAACAARDSELAVSRARARAHHRRAGTTAAAAAVAAPVAATPAPLRRARWSPRRRPR